MLIYTNGDSAAFIAGTANDVMQLVNLSYTDCVNRMISGHSFFEVGRIYANACVSFCNEFIANG